MRRLLVLLALVISFAPLHAQTATPPMGWNSWDAYGLTITETQFRDNVRVLHEKLQPFGYNYAVIDEGWFFENPEARPKPETLIYAVDAHGRYVPVPARFPSAVVSKTAARHTAGKLAATVEETSFAPLAAWVHAQGLKFGIHIVRGIPRVSVERNLPIAGSSFHAQDAADTSDACPWDPTNWGVRDNAAGQAWYDSLLAQYAAWGVDLLKVDCIADHPYKVDEIRMIRRAIDKTGRPMVLSLSPGPTNPSHAAEVDQLATMWRVSDDVWDLWQMPADKHFPQSIRGQFDHAATWSQIPTKHFPDLDMLAFGELRPSPGWGEPRRSRLTTDEERTVMTLWALMRSPLIIGANLTMLDEATLKILTNRRILELDQRAQGTATRFKHDDNMESWSVEVDRDGATKKVVAIFNFGDKPYHGAAHHLLGHNQGAVTDAWTGADLGTSTFFRLEIPAHGCVVVEEP